MNRENKFKTVWNIEDGDNYYYFDPNGCVQVDTFKNYPIDIKARENGNMFLTQEEAEFELERRKIEVVMRKYSRPFEHGKKNYFIYNNYNKSICIHSRILTDDGMPHFETEEVVQKVINEIGEERLLKYWFRVRKRCEFCGNEDVDYKSKNIYACRNCEDELLEYLEANNLIKTEKETVTNYFDRMNNYIADTYSQSTEEIIAIMADDEDIDLKRV